MANVKLYNVEAKEVGTIDLNDNVFNAKISEAAVHQVVVAQLANKRQGTQSAKTRSEVRGGGRKPWRQKGTGRARQGSIRSPQWAGGGIVFAPKPRDYRVSIPRSMRRVAMKSVLTSLVKENELFVLESLNFDAPKTKEAVKMFNAFDCKKALVVVAESNENVYKSIRNIENVSVIPANNINVYDLVKYPKVLMTKAAVEKLEEVYA